MLTPTQPALFAIDFDLTITTAHIHNLLSQAIHLGILQQTDLEAQWLYIKHVKPTATASDWKGLMEKLHSDGHYVAIASFGEFPSIIKRYLVEIIGVEDIFIESWLPPNPGSADKNTHLRNIAHHFNLTALVPEKIVLVDDSGHNCRAAKALGYRAIQVTPGDKLGKHLMEIATLSDYLKRK